MKITIGAKTYTEIKNLSFAPEADIVGNTLPINEFSVSIITTDTIYTGVFAYLYDDSNHLWAKYWITSADRKSDNQIDVVAQSLAVLLERITLPANMYSNTLATTIIADLFSSITARFSDVYEVDSSFSSAVISGYVPEQTARERLQWICFVIGAYVKAYFNDKIQILPINDTPTFVPSNKTYWKPEIAYDNYVTAIKARVYSYTQGTPLNTDKWVEVNGTYYIETSQEFTIANPLVPQTAPTNEIVFDSLTLLNNDNISGVLSRISTYYFQREKVAADILNNAEYYPAERIELLTDSDDMVRGYIRTCTFTFGLQSKSSIELVQTDTIIGENLIIRYNYGRVRIQQVKYKFPIDYVYDIQNPYIDQTRGGVRRIYRPLTSSATGTMVAGGVEDDEYYDIALEYVGGILKVISVDGVDSSNSIVEIE